MISQTESLDKIDIQILKALQEDARVTTKELAAKVNLSSTPVFERMKRLEKEGYIKKYVAVLDSEKPWICRLLQRETEPGKPRNRGEFHGKDFTNPRSIRVLQHLRKIRLSSESLCSRHAALPGVHNERLGSHRKHRLHRELLRRSGSETRPVDFLTSTKKPASGNPISRAHIYH